VGISKLFDTMDENEWHIQDSLDCPIPLGCGMYKTILTVLCGVCKTVICMPHPLGIAYVEALTFGEQVGISKLFDTMD
jgi:hypothetical protein